MASKIRCADCGFLAQRNLLTRGLMEVGEEGRESGNLNTGHGDSVMEPFPTCFAMHDLRERTKGQTPLVIGTMIRLEFDCDDFIEWRMGSSPKEHAEMRQLEEQRAWQAQQAEEQRRWQAEQAVLADKRYQDGMEIADKRHKESLVVGKSQAFGSLWQAYGSVAAFIVALIALIVSLFG